jgi:hypothetical protein
MVTRAMPKYFSWEYVCCILGGCGGSVLLKMKIETGCYRQHVLWGEHQVYHKVTYDPPLFEECDDIISFIDAK